MPLACCLTPLHVLTLANYQPAGGPFDGFGAAVDDQVRPLVVVEAQILFGSRIDDEREPVGLGHLGSLCHRQNALLHAVVGFDVEDGCCVGIDGSGQLGRGALVGVTGFHYFAATQIDHGTDRGAEVDVMPLGQHDFTRHLMVMGMQVLEAIGIAAYYHGGD